MGHRIGIGALALAWGALGLFGPEVSLGQANPQAVPAWIAAMLPSQQDDPQADQSGLTDLVQPDGDRAHAALMIGDRYPSATECKSCHETHYKQWSVSQHAYAQMSPVFNAMHGKILKLTNGTNGDFCIRCHTPVGMNLGEPEFMSNINRHPTSREGVTCIVCHRVNQAYGKLSGRLSIVQGDLEQPIYGPVGDQEQLDKARNEGGGQAVHQQVDKFFQLTTSAQCGTCHDVTLVNGFRLEEAFSEYKNSPASKKGISCQDCHMGIEPGKVVVDRDDPEFTRKNYAYGSAARIGNYKTPPRKLTNHMFVGPDYSILMPALFPLHDRIKEATEKDDLTIPGYTIRQWLRFDWKRGWGSDEFEDEVPDDYFDAAWDGSDEWPVEFRWTAPWDSPDARVEAREVIVENLGLLRQMRDQRLALLRNGYLIGEIETVAAGEKGIKFRVEVKNGTDGHNVPTGFDAERLVWLFVEVTDADGVVVMQSGDLDPNGDLRDLHSLYVHNHELHLDGQLFTLQSRFLTTNIRGGEREQVLAVPYSLTPLPFLRPERRSAVLLGRPGGARKHKKGIEPNGHRWAPYTIKKNQLTGHGPYTATIQLKAAMVPVNLINEIRSVGFDYGMSARDVADALVHGHIIRNPDDTFERVVWDTDAETADNQVVGHQVVWERVVTFDVHGGGGQQ